MQLKKKLRGLYGRLGFASQLDLNTQGLKIIEEKVLPSRIRSLNHRSTLPALYWPGGLKRTHAHQS